MIDAMVEKVTKAIRNQIALDVTLRKGKSPFAAIASPNRIRECAEVVARAALQATEPVWSDEELNLFREWFNSMQDTNPKYLEQKDCDLIAKVLENITPPRSER